MYSVNYQKEKISEKLYKLHFKALNTEINGRPMLIIIKLKLVWTILVNFSSYNFKNTIFTKWMQQGSKPEICPKLGSIRRYDPWKLFPGVANV